jgi:hypothetical protein
MCVASSVQPKVADPITGPHTLSVFLAAWLINLLCTLHAQADVVPVDEAAKEGEGAAAPSPAVQPAAAAAAPGMYAYNYTAADQAAAAGGIDPAMLAYQQQAGLVPGQQWGPAGLPDGTADGQQ